LQISTHAIGDGGVRRALDGYAAATKANGPRDRRHRIEHAEVVALSDMPRFWELGVIPAMQPLHCPGVMGMPLQPTLTQVAPEKRAGGWAWRSLRDQGATIVFASDWPVTPIDPMRSVQGALTRKQWSDDLPEQSQGLHETLASYTRDGAYAEFKEDRKGKLAPGMLADVAVLSHDLEAMPAEEISAVECFMTIAGGRVTFER
jgi:predicted amidohydrolase YtcJ